MRPVVLAFYRPLAAVKFFNKNNYKWCIGILETIFDGIQRPLKTIAEISKSVFVPRGVDLPCLDQDRLWHFSPFKDIKKDSIVGGGDQVGSVFENDLYSEHKILLNPKLNGRIVEVYPEGQYSMRDTICTVETNNGKTVDVKMSHLWPVRTPRPVAEKLPPKTPLLTGQRVLDALFPTVQGGTCAIPGAFGCGKTCIS